ncbi:hypothetical protein GQ43DRAFT_491303 [Delitschia confertaspora ATCC 74209]|uniref:Uncharacterized protein n=1 Tax=Delitschia confertaspora ATCC 74209 TaxID=1513339 RepID=A0A9P4JHN0_9PLEO|nr:hypothetical protein GQ43DRAFT_491303 [Delitschia confertaspora ATCC 74209]
MASQADSAAIRTKVLLGIARLELSVLDFSHAEAQAKHREPSQKLKERLLNVFKLEDCLREEESHFIDATVEEAELYLAIEQAGLRKETFKSQTLSYVSEPRKIPYLPISRVYGLDGLHRLLAGKDYLDKNDQWWILAQMYYRICHKYAIEPI